MPKEITRQGFVDHLPENRFLPEVSSVVKRAKKQLGDEQALLRFVAYNAVSEGLRAFSTLAESTGIAFEREF